MERAHDCVYACRNLQYNAIERISAATFDGMVNSSTM